MSSHDSGSPEGSELFLLRQQTNKLRLRIGELKKRLVERESLLALADEAFLVHLRELDHTKRDLIAYKNAADVILKSGLLRGESRTSSEAQTADELEHLLMSLEEQEHYSRDRPSEARAMMYVYRSADQVDVKKLSVKAIAFYLPTFCSLRTFQLAGGWSNVVSARPRYLGHFQPRLPDALGFYDPAEPGVIRKQIDLARQYGIYGFCFYHRELGGKHSPEPPLRHFLSDETADMKFCLCWVNERDTNPEGFVQSVLPVISDRRYICIDGKPLLIVLRPGLLHHSIEAAQRWRNDATALGLAGLYLIAAGPHANDPTLLGFDARLDLPPFHSEFEDVTTQHSLTDPNFAGRIFNYAEVAEAEINGGGSGAIAFRTVIPGWDEEPGRPGAGDCFAGVSPALYANWFRRSCDSAMLRRPEERLVFINAWNAWLDGAYLEPDSRFGFAYLHGTANVLRDYHEDSEVQKLVEDANTRFKCTSEAAIILHCHYEDLIAPIFDRYISNVKDADLFITAGKDVSKAAIEEVSRRYPNAFFICQENRGRDVRPFLLALRHIKTMGYSIACKVHTKKTPQDRSEGGKWRERLIGALLGSNESLAKAAEIFAQETGIGLLAPQGSVLDLWDPKLHVRNRFWLDRLLFRMGRPDLVGSYAFRFPAGSMYWFRVSALSGLDDLVLEEDAFEQELGQADGCLHHAVERLVALYAQSRGYAMRAISFEKTGTERRHVDSAVTTVVAPEFIKRQRELVERLQRKASSLERELANETWVRQQLMQSLSWRITAPLRTAARAARSLRSVLKTPPEDPTPAPSAPTGVTESITALDSDLLSELNELRSGVLKLDVEVFLSSGATLDLCDGVPEISVILNLNPRPELAFASLCALSRESNHAIEVIIVVDGEKHASSLLLDRLEGAKIIRKEEGRDFVTALNQAALAARGGHLLFLSTGARLMSRALDAALSTARISSSIGAVSGRILNMDGTLQEAGGVVRRDGTYWPYGRGSRASAPPFMFRRDAPACSSALLLTPRTTFAQLGGFTEACETPEYEGADYCLRLWKEGLRVVYEPNAAALGDGSVRASQPIEPEVFSKRHEQTLEKLSPADPCVIWKARSAGSRKSILFLEDRTPHRWLGAGLPRTRTILETLSKHFFVTFYPLIVFHEPWTEVYSDISQEVEVMLDSGPALLEHFFRERKGTYETIFVSRPHNMKVLLPIIKRNPDWFQGIRIIYDAEALFAARDIGFRRLVGAPMSEDEASAAIRAEIEMAAVADIVISVSDTERNAFLEHGIDPVYVIGHAVEPEVTHRPFEDRCGFLFVGAIREGSPNSDSMIWFLEEIFPIIRSRLGRQATITIAGICESQRLQDMASTTIRLLGPVDDLRDLYDKARVFVAPTRYGAGMPHKIHEAAAHGLPVVATHLLAAQLNWRDAVDIAAGSDPQTFGERCVQLHEDRKYWETLRENALVRVMKECSVKDFEERLTAIISPF